MYFSRIRLSENISHTELAAIANANGYKLHKLIWELFSDCADRKRDFLYRHEIVNGWPTFYTVSEREPKDSSRLWEIIPKFYEPKILPGERLAFKLRANPVQLAKKERSSDEIEAWCKSRKERGLSSKEPTKKRIRHDVVMAEKKLIGFKELPEDQRPHVATLIQKAGMAWLKEQGNEKGFFVEDDEERSQVRADGYSQHRFYKGKGTKAVEISTLEFNGVLTVSDPETFVNESLFKGIGPAKGFGCGLMLVRRV